MFQQKISDPYPTDSAGVDQSLARTADSLVKLGLQQGDASHFLAAAQVYEGVLNGTKFPVGSLKRAEIENNLGSTYCLIAQHGSTGSASAIALEKAEKLLKSALRVRREAAEPVALATTCTNLAIAYIASYAAVGRRTHLLSANLLLSEAITKFSKQGHEANLFWASSVQDHVNSLRPSS